ncbi:MAG: hypothetical protein J3Q66DRAFT_434289 [Benniella sp.]|nr:MAG: hypothetical protein J3Q66DRAFT_434289 [Benniella sp.]
MSSYSPRSSVGREAACRWKANKHHLRVASCSEQHPQGQKNLWAQPGVHIQCSQRQLAGVRNGQKKIALLKDNHTIGHGATSRLTTDCFHRFVAFGLNLFSSSLTQHKFDVRSTDEPDPSLRQGRARFQAGTQRQTAQVDKLEDQVQDAMDFDTAWEVGYYALNTFTKLVKQFPTVINSSGGVESVALDSRAHATSARMGLVRSGIGPAMLKSVAQKLCEQLKSEFLSKELGGQIVKNLFFIAKCFYSLPKVLDAALEEQDQEEQDVSDEEKQDDKEEAGDENKERQKGNKADSGAKLPVKRSLYRLPVATHISTNDLQPYLIPMIASIYRIVNDESIKGTDVEELKKLGDRSTGSQKRARPSTLMHTPKYTNASSTLDRSANISGSRRP